MGNVVKGLIYDEMSKKIIETARDIAVSEGTSNINVRRILRNLEITNRVFYNRFHNIDEVLKILADETVLKIRNSIEFSFDKEKDFFAQVEEIADKILLLSYELRMKFITYVFENDSVNSVNYNWWTKQIAKIIEYGITNGYFKDIDIEVASYSIWCFIRGFNADAISRNIPLDEALEKYHFGIRTMLAGMQA